MSETRPFYNFEAIVPKLRDLIGHGLTGGVGEPEAGKLCVEAAVCLVLGLPHGDKAHDCVGAPDRRFAIRLNDAQWSSNQARAEGMAEFAVAHLGSVKMTARQREVWRGHLVGQTIRRIVPMALRIKGATTAMLEAADRCEREGTREAAEAARSIARAFAAADVAFAAANAANVVGDKALRESASIAVEAYTLARAV